MASPDSLGRRWPRIVIGSRRHARLLALVLGAAAAIAGAEDPAAAASASVELSASQAHAVTVETLGTHAFPRVRDEIGAVALPEDLAVIQAESALLAALAENTLASRELARATTLASGDGIARRELEQAVADRANAAAALLAARASLRALGVGDADMAHLAEGGAAAQEERAGERWLAVSVLEADAPLIHAGQAASASVAAFPQRSFTGTVRRVYASVDPLLHRMVARVAVADADNELLPGMLAEVRIAIGEPLQAAAIPAHGVVREGDGSWTAWVTADGRRFTQRVIQPGQRDGDWVQVLSGLAEGERVVADGALLLDNMINASAGD